MKKINRAYRLLEDLKQPPLTLLDTIIKWTMDGKHEKSSQEEWKSMMDKEMVVVAKKGDLFFKSKLYTKNGIPCLYPMGVDPKVLGKTDRSFGLGLLYDNSKFSNWQHYLELNFDLFQKGKFEETDTDQDTFEQIHLIQAHEERKKILREEIVGIECEIGQIDESINKINS